MRFEPSLFGSCAARSMRPRNKPNADAAEVPYPVPFGTVGIDMPYVIYHGNEGTSTWNGTTSFKASTHLGWCIGPVVWRLLMAEGTTLWSEILPRKAAPTWGLLDTSNVTPSTGPITTDERVYIEGDTFGGHIEFYIGDNPVNLSPRVAELYGVPLAEIPKNNGIAQLFFDEFVWAPKKPSSVNVVAQVTRFPKAPALDPTYAEIPNTGTLVYEASRAAPDKVGLIEHPYPPDANPAHILYELLTDEWFGLRISPDMIDVTSFNTAAQTLFNEGFGLSFLWAEQCPVEEIIADVIEHIQGVLFVDRNTGKWTLRLMRRDYALTDPSIPVLTESSANVSGMQVRHCADAANELAVQWMNPATEQLEAVVVEETASFFSTEEVNSVTRTYYMIRTTELALKVAVRDLRQLAVRQRVLSVETTRAYAHLRPGDVVKVDWPRYRLNNVPFRVKSIDVGAGAGGVVKMQLVEDIYALDCAVPPPLPYNTWTQFYTDPTPVDEHFIASLPFAWMGAAGEDAAVLVRDAARDFKGVEVAVKTTAGASDVWSVVGEATPAETAVVGVALAAEPETVVDVDTFLSQFDGTWGPDLGWPMFIGNEIIIPIAYDSNTKQLTLLRGAHDTVPAQHAVGDRIWITNRHLGWRISIGKTPPFDYRLHTLTMLGRLDVPPVQTFSGAANRAERPLRPANIKTNGIAWPAAATATANVDFVVEWSIRNREKDRDQPALWTDASHTPETGQETHVEIVDTSTNTVAWSVIEPTATSVTVTGGLPAGNYLVRVWSRRDGLDSLNVIEQNLTIS